MPVESYSGKAAIVQWMNETARSLQVGRSVDLFTQDITAGEYIVGLEDFITNVRNIGWTNAEIERYAHQLEEACRLANSDPHPEYLSEARIDEFVEAFKKSAGYKIMS
jgi:hypothetical protein